MKLLFNYIPFQLLIGVILGALCCSCEFLLPYVIFLYVSLLFVAVWFYIVSYIKQGLAICTILFLGGMVAVFSIKIHQKHKYKVGPLLGTQGVMWIEIKTPLKPRLNQHRYYAKLVQFQNEKMGFSILVEDQGINKTLLRPGDLIKTRGFLWSIPTPKSPYGFNYKAYLNRNNIDAKISLNEYEIVSRNRSFFNKIRNLRFKWIQYLNQSHLSKQTKTFIYAVLFGEKSYLSVDLKNAFTNAGVVHILAISGMHIGMLYVLCNAILSFLKRFKKGIYLQTAMVMGLMFCFAIFSGFSNATVRSVLMLGFLMLSKLKMNHKSCYFEPIVTSALLILICNPYELFDVGFQMSYAAVISIVAFFSLWRHKIKFKYKFVQYLFGMLIVSLCAQMGGLGISILYFHQFSLQFIWANFFAVLLLPLVLYGGVFVCLKIWVSLDDTYVEFWYDSLVSFYLDVISSMGKLDYLVLKDLSINPVQVVCYYLLLFAIWLVIKKKTYLRVCVVLVGVLVAQLIYGLNQYYLFKKNELLIYSNRSLLITQKYAQHLYVYSENQSYKNIIKSNVRSNHIKYIHEKSSKIFEYKGMNYFIVEDGGIDVTNLNLKKPLILILHNNPKINLDRWLNALKPVCVIMTLQNGKNYLERWEVSCEMQNIDVYDMREKGFYRRL